MYKLKDLIPLVEEQIDLIMTTGDFDEEKTKEVASDIPFLHFYSVRLEFLDQVAKYSELKMLEFMTETLRSYNGHINIDLYDKVVKEKTDEVISVIDKFSNCVIDNLKHFEIPEIHFAGI